MSKHAKLFLVAILVLILAFSLSACKKDTTVPQPYDSFTFDSSQFRLITPTSWELEIGDSRSVDFAFRETIENRKLTWYTSDSNLATVDSWGRVTAKAVGTVDVVAANSDQIASKATLKVVNNSTKLTQTSKIVNYTGEAATYGSALQKVVTRFAISDEAIPASIKSIITANDYTNYQTAVTVDGATWAITAYGVLRTDNTAENERDKLQRFMGDRYFYSVDTKIGNVLGIVSDGEKGIWTIMSAGITHIEMIEMNGIDKATTMAENTADYVSRRGMVSEAYLQADGTWKPNESDNDGLWTSMYGAGELMRYASLKNNPSATASEIAAAKASATLATEAVLLLSNISMRQGTVEAYVRYQPNALFDKADGRFYSETALEENGDPSIQNPWVSPAEAFLNAWDSYIFNDGEATYFLTEDYLDPYAAEDWSDPRTATEDTKFAKRTRNLEGYIARTYSLSEENNATDGYAHWSLYSYSDDNKTAEGVSTRTPDQSHYYINGENLRGVKVDASCEIPARLWNSLLGEGYSVDDIIYKGDTSSDEIIGHLFLYKIAYDILGAEDPEIASIISNTMERFAQHISDNSYMMVDGSGQPGTWSKFNRDFFYNSSQLGGAPLTSSVLLCAFKVAAYVTGNQKWEDEYRMAATDSAYEYAKLMTLYSEQCDMYMLMLVNSIDIGLPESIMKNLSKTVREKLGTPLTDLLNRLFLNYSDEEMAMLAFYLLFQLETDETLLTYYRAAMDDWWESIKYSENPLWYLIYQLAYPNEEKTDAFGNSLIETAAWSLSRHPIDTRRYCASNTSRDDVRELDINDYIKIGDGTVLCYDISKGDVMDGQSGITGILKLIGNPELPWAVAAPDERSMHKYNGASYNLDGNYNPNEMEGSTTYTLPFWLGVYHGMIKL